MGAAKQLSLQYLVRNGIRRGLLGGERRWLVLGASALALQTVIKVVRKRPKVVFSEKLGVGESLVLEHQPPRPRRRGHNGRRESPASQPEA